MGNFLFAVYTCDIVKEDNKNNIAIISMDAVVTKSEIQNSQITNKT